VKGLENRVNELEELTKAKDEENETLRKQVEALHAQLVSFKGSQFDFDFNIHSKSVSEKSPSVRNPFQNGLPGQQLPPSPSSGSITDNSTLFLSGISSLATSPENDVNKNGTPNIDMPFDLFGTNSAGPVSFSSRSNQNPAFSSGSFGGSSSQSNSATLQRTSPILDSFAQTLASLTAQSHTPQNFPNTVTPLSLFSPSSPGSLFDVHDPLYTAWRDPIEPMDDSSFDIFDTMFSSPGLTWDTSGLTEFVTESSITPINTSSDPALTCPELWEKVKNHPQFDDLDIDQLCSEMRNKAKVCILPGSSARV
jgi:hypothetical protein